uniref:Trypsin n=1 Tax=Mycena chlorophos TaxID=658473 RepID=A0ABQ0L1V6_MYCCL|nr:trypsin [Mycena chlorophos]
MAIYGNDGDQRKEITDPTVPDDIRRASKAIAVLVKKNDLRQDNVNGGYTIASDSTLQKYLLSRFQKEKATTIDPEVRFTDQPDLGFGTAFVVANNILATSAHNFESRRGPEHGLDIPYHIANTYVVFGWEDGVKSFPNSQVHTIKRVLTAGDPADAETDHALFQLDTPALGAEIPRLEFVDVENDPPRRGAEIIAAGFPIGLPMKVTSGIISDPVDSWSSDIKGTLSIFVGNSGSPVFRHGAVVGIVARTPSDYYVVNGMVKANVFSTAYPTRYTPIGDLMWALPYTYQASHAQLVQLVVTVIPPPPNSSTAVLVVRCPDQNGQPQDLATIEVEAAEDPAKAKVAVHRRVNIITSVLQARMTPAEVLKLMIKVIQSPFGIVVLYSSIFQLQPPSGPTAPTQLQLQGLKINMGGSKLAGRLIRELDLEEAPETLTTQEREFTLPVDVSI